MSYKGRLAKGFTINRKACDRDNLSFPFDCVLHYTCDLTCILSISVDRKILQHKWNGVKEMSIR